MDDLTLYALLLDGRWNDARVPALLEGLASLSLARRAPFFGVLESAFDASDARVRELALLALVGAEGPLALAAIARGLSDGSPAVRLAAVRALHGVADTQPLRLAHAVFHRDADVRRAVVEGGMPDGADALAFALLSDPECRASLSARKLPKSAPPGAWPAVLELHASGAIDDSAARRLLRTLDLAKAEAWLAHARRRPPDVVEAWLAACRTHRGPDASLDPPGTSSDLDALISIFWGDDDAGDAFFAAFASALAGALRAFQREACAAIVAVGTRRGALPGPVLVALLAVLPETISFPFLDRQTRRGIAHALYRRSEGWVRLDDDTLQSLLWTDICVHPSGGPDLYVVGGLLHLARSSAYDLALRWIGEDTLVESLLSRPVEHAPFLTLPDDHPGGRPKLFRAAWERDPAAAARLTAEVMRLAAADKLDFVEALHVGEALAVLRVVFDRHVELPPGRADAVGVLLGRKLPPADVTSFVDAWLAAEPAHPLGAATFGVWGGSADADVFVATMLALDPGRLAQLVGALGDVTTLPFGKELALARALEHSAHRPLAAWAVSRLPRETVAPEPPPADGVSLLPARVANAIRDASALDLATALRPALTGAWVGVAAVLSTRIAPPGPHVAATAALIGAHDAPTLVDRELGRFAGVDAAFEDDVVSAVLHGWDRALAPSLLALAVLHRWDRHGEAFEARALADHGSLSAAAKTLCTVSTPLLLRAVFAAIADRLMVAHYREPAKVERLVDDALVAVLVEQLSGAAGVEAAAGLVAIHRSRAGRPYVDARRPDVFARLPDLPDPVRARLADLVDARDLPPAPPPPRVEAPLDEAVVTRIRGERDVATLAALCLDARALVVHEATLRLLDLGPEGEAALVELLEASTDVSRVRPIVDSVALWSDPHALARARAIVHDPSRSAELRHRTAQGLAERGERGVLLASRAVLLDPADGPWFRPADWTALVRLTDDPLGLAVDLASSPHPHVYLSAIELLLRGDDRPVERHRGLRAFLAAGAGRMGELRRRAARRLLDHGDPFGFPLLLEGQLESVHGPGSPLLAGLPWSLVLAATRAFLMGGRKVAKESALLAMLGQPGVDPFAQDEAMELLLHHATVAKVRQAVAQRLRRSFGRMQKLRRLADTFAWGVRVGRELTGSLFRVQMVSGTGLGHTRFNENRIFVTPLPILRRDRWGREVVEGLILHELGHHLFHKGPGKQEVWAEAEREGMHGLLNLVADEHLERNLRALDASFGDRLKRLAAYAFQHTAREIPVLRLLGSLQARAFSVLSDTHLGVARDVDCVRVDHGEVLAAMERSGLAFSRFMRALRMGLGNRHADPKVEAGLALFRDRFRESSMPRLLEIAKKLRDIFGWEAQLVESMGPHEGLEGDEAERTVWGDGITDDDVEREVERVLDPRKKKARPASEGGAGTPWINIAPEAAFDRITEVEVLPHDPVEHARYVRDVARSIPQMREVFEALGLRMVPARKRLSGRAFDRSRTEALVVRGDPRVLVSREQVVKADLFLGVAVDCSGSMQTGQLIERAKRFATLLAESARGLPGIDVRTFGFTDTTIYDAGDASRCAAHALHSGGGNNDAAALYHVASEARRSRRKARLLVMISDGLPTECSVAALRGLVSQLVRREGMCCAQVAVRPLEEQCFPHHVLLTGDDEGAAVRQFGRTIARLVQRTLIPLRTAMSDKLTIESITVGAVMEATFFHNPVAESGFRHRATHLDGKRAPKVVLCDDPRIRAGVPCLVRVVAIRKPDRSDRGAIEVEFVRAQEFKLEGVWLDPVVSKKLQVLLESGLNILLDGPQGCGKTVLARTIAKSLGMEFVFFNCGAVVEATDFLATIQVRASATGSPVTDFLRTELLIALEEASQHPERRYLVFLDELNRCQESARNALMPALDSTRKVYHPIENRFLAIPENVQFIAAVNRGSEFSATFGIDAAQLDRFAPLQMDYLPPEEEVKLLAGRHPEVGKEVLEEIVAIADAVRKSADLRGTLSVRATEEACIYLKHPLMEGEQKKLLPEVLKSAFCGRFGGKAADPTSDAGAVWTLIQRVLRERRGESAEAS